MAQKYWLGNNPNAQITDAEVTALGELSATELDLLDGSSAGTVVASKAAIYSSAGVLPGIHSGITIQSGTAVIKHTATEQFGGAYGLFYPDLGMLVFNGPIINTSASLGTVTTINTLGGNNDKFVAKIKTGAYFQSRREEVVTSQHYFCRVPNKEFNFSSNPTFATASDGSFTQATFFKNPKTFVTQVGLYNDAGELLAVAKLSKPLLKSYSREAIIKVKLDF